MRDCHVTPFLAMTIQSSFSLDEGESPRFDMPWHVATLNKERANTLRPYIVDSLVWA